MNRERLADDGVRWSGASRGSHSELRAIGGAATPARPARRNGSQPYLTPGEGTAPGTRQATGWRYEHGRRRRQGARTAAATPA